MNVAARNASICAVYQQSISLIVKKLDIALIIIALVARAASTS